MCQLVGVSAGLLGRRCTGNAEPPKLAKALATNGLLRLHTIAITQLVDIGTGCGGLDELLAALEHKLVPALLPVTHIIEVGRFQAVVAWQVLHMCQKIGKAQVLVSVGQERGLACRCAGTARHTV